MYEAAATTAKWPSTFSILGARTTRLPLLLGLVVLLGAAATMLLRERMQASTAIAAMVLFTQPAHGSGVCGRTGILNLLERVSGLPPETRELCHGIYHISARTSSDGQTEAEALRAAEHQTAVIVTDTVEGHSTHFNPLRARKPIAFKRVESAASAFSEIASSAGASCDFCSPEELTAEETWGRVRGAHSVTAANAFRSDGAHGLLVFSRHDPLSVTLDELSDGFAVVQTWFEFK